MNTPKNLSRRRVLQAAGISVAVAFTTRSIHAADDLPLLEEDDSAAEKFEYVADSGSYSRSCGRCSKYQGSTQKTAGPCTVFPEYSVTIYGVCSEFLSVPL